MCGRGNSDRSLGSREEVGVLGWRERVAREEALTNLFQCQLHKSRCSMYNLRDPRHPLYQLDTLGPTCHKILRPLCLHSELYFDDEVMGRILDCTLAYGPEKRRRYNLFMRRKLTVTEMRAFTGALLLLGIHGVKNHRKAWSMAKAQVLVRLQDLLTCQQFELIGAF